MAKKKEQSKYTDEQLAAMSPEDVRRLPPEEVALFSEEQISSLSQQQRDSLTNEQREALGKKSAAALEEAGTHPGNPGEVNLAPGYNPDTSPNQPLREKVPHYAPGSFATQGGTTSDSNPVGHGKTDHRVPPENVSAPVSQELAPGQEGSKSAAEAFAKTEAGAASGAPTAASVGLPRPELRPGLDPLPEEDPTPSTVPIPPPGPRRVA